jgi:hypothetical protein
LEKTSQDSFSNIVSFSFALEFHQQFSQRCRLDWKSQNKKYFVKIYLKCVPRIFSSKSKKAHF